MATQLNLEDSKNVVQSTIKSTIMSPVYHRTDRNERQQIQRLGRDDLQERQFRQLNELLATVLPQNEFYRQKLGEHPITIQSMNQLAELPVTTKDELVAHSSGEGFAANLTFSVDAYSRFHRTSGTRGKPMIVLDTNEDWNWWMETWQYVLDSAEMVPEDRVVMAFSFGPFIGFWSAFDAATERGSMVVPTGSFSTTARLELIMSIGATVVFCTPSYALHMAEVAHVNQIPIQDSKVTRIIVAGEPGGSVPAIRDKIEEAWNAKVIDHSGASEAGPWGFADSQQTGIHINEAQYIAEFIKLDADGPAEPGQLSELVLTCLGRYGSPIIRYRTGDLVRAVYPEADCRFVLLEGGVLGRTDDMMIIRGVNVFPTSIEQILRQFPEIAEYRMTAFKEGAMDQLKIEIEDGLNDAERVKSKLSLELGFRVDVHCVEAGSLPRFEAKGKRFVDQR